MRIFKKFPVGPEILSMLALIALVTVVYLCSLPETFHSLSHRKANAAEMMAHARERVVKEGVLFASLVHAADQAAVTKLRQQLVDNEREFHDLTAETIAELPEAAADVEIATGLFDHVSAAGWRAASTAPQMEPEQRRAVLEGAFARDLDELRSKIERIELGLQRHDVNYNPGEVRRSVDTGTRSL